MLANATVRSRVAQPMATPTCISKGKTSVMVDVIKWGVESHINCLQVTSSSEKLGLSGHRTNSHRLDQLGADYRCEEGTRFINLS